MFEWLTLWPTSTDFPVSSQRRDIGRNLLINEPKRDGFPRKAQFG
jgi:hypothetical protein